MSVKSVGGPLGGGGDEPPEKRIRKEDEKAHKLGKSISSNPQTSFWDTLPSEVKLLILSFLNPDEREKAREINKELNAIQNSLRNYNELAQFLISKLDAAGARQLQKTEATLRMIGPHIKYLQLQGTEIDKFFACWNTQNFDLTNLKILVLQKPLQANDIEYHDDELFDLSNLLQQSQANLEELHLVNYGTEQPMASLNCNKIYINGHVHDAGVISMQGGSNCTEIFISNCSGNTTALYFQDFDQLESIHLDGIYNNITEIDLENCPSIKLENILDLIAHCPSLTSLNLRGTEIDPDTLLNAITQRGLGLPQGAKIEFADNDIIEF